MSDPHNKIKKRMSIVVQKLLTERTESEKLERISRLSSIDPNQV